MAPSDRLRTYERYRAARLQTSPWQDFVIASQVTGRAVAFLDAARSEETGYRNERTLGYWPAGETPDEMIERLMGSEPREWRKRQLRYSRILRYLFPMAEIRREGWETDVGWEILVTCLVETVAWWTEIHGDPPWGVDFLDPRMPPDVVIRECHPDGLAFLLERATAFSRGDPPVVLG